IPEPPNPPVSSSNPVNTAAQPVSNPNDAPETVQPPIKQFQNSKRIIFISGALLIVLILIALLVLLHKQVSLGQMYTDSTSGYSISPPAGWNRDQTAQPDSNNTDKTVLLTDWETPAGNDTNCGESCPSANLTIRTYKTVDSSLDKVKDDIVGA